MLSDRCSPQAADTTGNAEIQRIQRLVSFRNMADAEILQNGSNLFKSIQIDIELALFHSILSKFLMLLCSFLGRNY